MSSYRLLLVGKTGKGKSATGNTILRRKEFISKMGCNSVTTENKASKTIDPKGREITVVDTIGLCDTKVPMTANAIAVQNSLSLATPGPHAFLIIVEPSRHTEEEKDTIDMLRIIFGQKLFHHAILVFTKGDSIPDPDEFFQSNRENESMRKLMNECRGGCMIINNNEQDQIKVDDSLRNLMEKVRNVSNEGKTYYDEDISILQVPLKKYADEWTASRWKSEQIETLIREQGEERERRYNERITKYKVEKTVMKREKKLLKQEYAVNLEKAELRGYRRGIESQPTTNVIADISQVLVQGVVDFAVGRLTGASSNRRTGSEMLQNVAQRMEQRSVGSHTSLTSNTFNSDFDRSFYRSGTHLWFTGEKKNGLTYLGKFSVSNKK